MNTRSEKKGCAICGGETRKGETTVSVELGFGVVVIRHVPAMVCQRCGESWIEDGIAQKVESMVESAKRDRMEVEVLAYAS